MLALGADVIFMRASHAKEADLSLSSETTFGNQYLDPGYIT